MAFAQVPDYDDPYSPILTDKDVYSWTEKMEITIIAPSWDANRFAIDSIGDDEGHFIKISTSENSLEPYKLTETDLNSGIFTGEVIFTGFLHDVDGDGSFDTNPRTIGNGPTNGFLETKRDSGVTISFEFADGVIVSESVMISWNIGDVFFENPSYLVDEDAKITVIDRDMNLNPEAEDQVLVQVTSGSDAAGVELSATETSPDSGRFEATLSFSSTLQSSGNRLHALPGERIDAMYHDYTLPKPYGISDNLEVTSFSELQSDIPPLERINLGKTSLATRMGTVLSEATTGEQIQVVGSVHNNQNFVQPFVFIIQIKDSHENVVSISWVTGQLQPNQNLDLSQSWAPQQSGTYFIETFVWDSLSDANALSPSLSELVIIQ